VGQRYVCDGVGVDAAGNPVDEIYIRHDHLLSDLSSSTITIYRRAGSGRRHKSKGPILRSPVVRYDAYTDKLTLNGKRCRPICRGQCE
jgi:hypothetical protein